MTELLTKGIGNKDFKESELGKIPKSWEVCLLDDLTKRGSGHTPAKKNPSYWNGGIKWVSLADSSRLDNRFIFETSIEISEEGLANSSAVLHSKGTVILSRDAGVGKSAVLAEEMAVSQHFMAWDCKNEVDNWFLYYWMQESKPLFEIIAIGSTIKTIGLDYFKKLKIACPSLKEQKLIASKLLSVDECIDKLKSKLIKNQSLKKSLMQDLLTGKVRVTLN
jgi:type I restriction enzyme S subunit